MVRQDLIGALKNAIERGETLFEAKVSLVNAGYSRLDIEEALKSVRNSSKRDIPIPKKRFLPPLPRH